jgi:hypothetical protein
LNLNLNLNCNISLLHREKAFVAVWSLPLVHVCRLFRTPLRLRVVGFSCVVFCCVVLPRRISVIDVKCISRVASLQRCTCKIPSHLNCGCGDSCWAAATLLLAAAFVFFLVLSLRIKSLPVAHAFEASVDVQPILTTLQGAQQARVHEYVNMHVHAPQTHFAEDVTRLARTAAHLLSQLSNAVRARIARALREFLVRNRVRFFRFVLAWRLINMIPEIVVLVLLLEAAWICMLLLLATLIDES